MVSQAWCDTSMTVRSCHYQTIVTRYLLLATENVTSIRVAQKTHVYNLSPFGQIMTYHEAV